jgi:hypothetical protein
MYSIESTSALPASRSTHRPQTTISLRSRMKSPHRHRNNFESSKCRRFTFESLDVAPRTYRHQLRPSRPGHWRIDPFRSVRTLPRPGADAGFLSADPSHAKYSTYPKESVAYADNPINLKAGSRPKQSELRLAYCDRNPMTARRRALIDNATSSFQSRDARCVRRSSGKRRHPPRFCY